MTGTSKIEWTEQTWNPVVGCSIVSPGCTNCYAMKMAARIEAMGNQPRYAGTTRKVNGNAIWTGKLAKAPDSAFLAPLRRKIPTTYFVNSMGDLFHEDCPDEWIDRVFAVMALSPQHTFQVLTKRAVRMRQWFRGIADRKELIGLTMLTIVDRIPYGHRQVPWPLPNVWLGVSTERQKEADERIPLLLDTLAAVRFISAEPLLGPIDLKCITVNGCDRVYPLRGMMEHHPRGTLDHPKLDWIIVGGESGHNARPMHPDWARSLRDGADVDVPFFFKQWGEWAPIYCEEDGSFEYSRDLTFLAPDGQRIAYEEIRNSDFPVGSRLMERVGKKAAGRLLDGIEHNDMPGYRPSAEAAE